MAVTPLTDNQHVGRETTTHIWEFTPDAAGGGSNQREILARWGANTIIVDAWVDCITAETGATTSKLDIEVNPDKDHADGSSGNLTLFAGTGDNGGATGRDLGTVTPRPTGAQAGAEWSVWSEYTVSGTESTLPVFRIYVEAMRTSY